MFCGSEVIKVSVTGSRAWNAVGGAKSFIMKFTWSCDDPG